METETQNTVGKIYARMADAMADIGAVGKTSRNESQHFNFRGIDAVMNELHGILSKNRIFILQKLLEATHENRTSVKVQPDKTTKETIMTHHFNRIEYQFMTDDGSSVSCTVVGESADSGDKGANKCMAVALKYALTQVFCIPTEDQGEPKDPDAQSHEFAATREARNEAQKKLDDAAGVRSAHEQQAEPVSNGNWRMHEIHFGKNKGIKLVDLEPASLKWYQETWKPKEYKGNFSKADTSLRAALDASMKSGEGDKEGAEDSTQEEWKDKWKDALVCVGEFVGKKLGEVTHEQRVALYNSFKPKLNTSTVPAEIYLKKALVDWKNEMIREMNG